MAGGLISRDPKIAALVGGAGYKVGKAALSAASSAINQGQVVTGKYGRRSSIFRVPAY